MIDTLLLRSCVDYSSRPLGPLDLDFRSMVGFALPGNEADRLGNVEARADAPRIRLYMTLAFGSVTIAADSFQLRFPTLADIVRRQIDKHAVGRFELCTNDARRLSKLGLPLTSRRISRTFTSSLRLVNAVLAMTMFPFRASVQSMQRLRIRQDLTSVFRVRYGRQDECQAMTRD